MDLASDRAELPLDRRVHVLVARVDLFDPLEQRNDFRELLGREDPGRREATRVQCRRLAVVGEELGIVGAEELPHLGGELRADAPGPERQTVAAFRSRAAISSVSSAVIAIRPSAALCGNGSPVAYDSSVSE